MSLQFGRGAFIKLGEEGSSSYGTIASSMPVNNRIISASFQKTQEKERKTHLSQSGAGGFQNGHFEAFLNVGGSIDLPLLYEGTGMLLKASLGAVTTTDLGVSEDPRYQHDYEPASDGELPSLSIGLQRGTGSYEVFLGCKVSSLSISGSAGEEITASFDIIAQDSNSRGTATTSSFGSGRQMFHFECGVLNYNSATYKMKSFEFSLDNKLERRNVLGDKKTLEPITNDIKDVTLNVTLEMEDNALFDAYIAGTQSDVEFTLTNSPDGDSCNILIRNCYITDYSDDVNTFGALERTMVFVGEGDSSNEPIRIRVTNNQSTGVDN
tara:strand:+ start:1713 stop:2684 length:972 start_codon:yes stop_codon:yes gene_type:complete